MINEHADWCHVTEHEKDPGVGCFSTMSIAGGVSTWMVDDVLGEGVVVIAQNGRLDHPGLLALIGQLQRYAADLRQPAA